jgi:hypothetical protein
MKFGTVIFYKTLLSKYEFREIRLHDSHTSLHQKRKEISPCTPHSFQPNRVKFGKEQAQVTPLSTVSS